jgi:two-component sensor histidine kinase
LPARPRPGLLQVSAERDSERLRVVVADDGRGLPADFDLEASNSLGLQIVRTLIEGELSGSLEFRPRDGGGTEVVVDVPLDQSHHRAAPLRPNHQTPANS